MKPLVILAHPFIPGIIKSDLAPHARIKIARNRDELKSFLKTADGLITRFSDVVDEDLLRHAPRLRAVSCFAVGIDNIDLKACAERRVRVCNTPDVLTQATAELTLALLLAAARRIPEGDLLCRSGRFKGWAPEMLLGLNLKGRTAVLVGQGRIGSETGRLFEGIGLKVEWITRGTSSALICAKLKRAQILSLHTPLNEQTRHWLNRSRLALLPHDAIVLNTTRGPVVDEKALIQTLEKRKIFAAGLDVYEKEPRLPLALRKLSNVVLLPHIGSATRDARSAMARLSIQGMLALLSGKAPHNEVKF